MDGTLWVMSWLRRAAIDKVGCRSPNSEGTREFSDRLAGRGEAAELFLRRPITNKPPRSSRVDRQAGLYSRTSEVGDDLFYRLVAT
jgi:hypothetical protein